MTVPGVSSSSAVSCAPLTSVHTLSFVFHRDRLNVITNPQVNDSLTAKAAGGCGCTFLPSFSLSLSLSLLPTHLHTTHVSRLRPHSGFVEGAATATAIFNHATNTGAFASSLSPKLKAFLATNSEWMQAQVRLARLIRSLISLLWAGLLPPLPCVLALKPPLIHIPFPGQRRLHHVSLTHPFPPSHSCRRSPQPRSFSPMTLCTRTGVTLSSCWHSFRASATATVPQNLVSVVFNPSQTLEGSWSTTSN